MRDDLVALWHHQVARRADGVALIQDQQQWSFRRIDRWSDAVADALRGRGVIPGARVMLYGERSAAAVVAQLAVLKLGACYVPLEPQWPEARRRLIANDARSDAVLTWDDRVDAAALAADCDVAVTLRVDEYEDAPPIAFKPAAACAGQAMYLLYTSGTSGLPKGVLGTRLGLLNRLRWQWRSYPFAAGERVAQRTNPGFVDAVAETWGALLAGVPLVIIPAAVVADVDAFIAAVAEHCITRLVIVPSLLSTLLMAVPELGLCWPRLRWCVCSGEVLTPPLARAFQRALPHCQLLNLYGMTEAAGDLSAALVCGTDSLQHRLPVQQVNLGKPLPGLRVCVLNADGQAVPAGTMGEIHVGGDALAQGYHGRGGLTADCFRPDPSPEYPGARLYATGDLGCINSAGELEYHGRRDSEVKIRGHRLNLCAVEAHAEQHPAVGRCAALLVTPDQNASAAARSAAEAYSVEQGQLVLFVELAPSAELTSAGVRAFLRQHLPDYMMPALIDIRAALPRLPNGKIDRQALRASRVQIAAEGCVGPGAQQQVAMIWQEILRCPPPGSGSRFLHLGGNSLTAALVVSRLRSHFDVALSVGEFFDCGTLADVTHLLLQRQRLKRLQSAPALLAVVTDAAPATNENDVAPAAPDGTVDVLDF